MLYIIHYQKMYVEGQELSYSLDDFVRLANDAKQVKEAQKRSAQEETLL
jgi:hypothetical protein